MCLLPRSPSQTATTKRRLADVHVDTAREITRLEYTKTRVEVTRVHIIIIIL